MCIGLSAGRIRRSLLCLGCLAALATGPAFAGSVDVGQAFEPWQRLLELHLDERRLPGGGLVSAFSYTAALDAGEISELLDRQDTRLATFNPSVLETRSEALAFWTNAYNYFMVAYILRNAEDGEPVEGVKDFGRLFNPFRMFEQKLFEVGGRDHSLQEIELDILLGESYAQRGWKDARIHFMVNCASVGCPPLRKQIYTADNLDEMLAENTRLALDTPLHLERDGDRLRLTSLFDWYKDDFVEQSGSVRAFVRQHGSDRARRRLRETKAIEFIEYDWALNRPENFRSLLEAAGAQPFD